MSNYDKVKIVVVGDSGVGKTSAVYLICNNQPLTSTAWTVGASLEVKLHEYKEGTPQQKSYFVDLWDIGGSSSHENTRPVFYNGVNGIILVHDLNNRKSEVNLHRWIMEILNRDSGKGNQSSDEDFDPEQFAGSSHIPIFVIGTKADTGDGVRQRSALSRATSIADECGADEIFINCLDIKAFAPGSTSAVKLSRFFDRVIERRFHPDHSHSYYDRRKLWPQAPRIFSDE
ncbi:unnamed protein product [Allacma fusca]|uniref:Rab-like protein 3 n=1 Tax=Allacma fusca TaxID=39272 RepID=A0A8J2J5Y0_9HEXA|nr:unnamed protein product [Allacma fusca]